MIASPMASGQGGWSEPAGGWDALYDDFNLDDWSHDNGSDAWDASAPGEAGKAPGGIRIETVDGMAVISIEDAGDPREAGFADPSNRKLYLQIGLGVEGDIFETGVTFTARFRINPNPIDAPANGYTLHDGGKGNVGIAHHDAPGNFSFALDTGGLLYFGNENQTPLEIGDEFQFHSIWATAKKSGDLYTVNVYVDGKSEPAFTGDIALGTGSDGEFANYMAIGAGSTGRDGAFQIDYIGYKMGINMPSLASSVKPGTKLPSLWGELKSKVIE